jgi:hypothetical protein
MAIKLEQRVAELERQVARLQKHQNSEVITGREWVDDLYGKFANDPMFDHAMKLGRKYRKSLGTRTRKSRPTR